MSIHIMRKAKKGPARILAIAGLLALLVCLAAPSVRADNFIPDDCDPGTASDSGSGASFANPSLQSNILNRNTTLTEQQIVAAQQVYSKLPVQDMSACLMRLIKYFDVIEGFLQGTGKNPFVAILLALVSGYLNQVCNYVMTTIISYIDTAICIPVPNLNLTLSLPSLKQGSCDGSGLTGLLSTFMTPASMPSSTAPAPVNNMSTGAEAFKPDPSTSGNSAYKNYFNNPANK